MKFFSVEEYKIAIICVSGFRIYDKLWNRIIRILAIRIFPGDGSLLFGYPGRNFAFVRTEKAFILHYTVYVQPYGYADREKTENVTAGGLVRLRGAARVYTGAHFVTAAVTTVRYNIENNPGPPSSPPEDYHYIKRKTRGRLPALFL